jgi:hypothetical protein
MPTTNILSMQAAREKRAAPQQAKEDKQAERLAAQEKLRLHSHLFNADDISGYCTTLNTAGAEYYKPLFAEYGATLIGKETFRELQYLTDDILDSIYDDIAETRKAIREGRLHGAELQFVNAVITEDLDGIQAASNRIIEEGAAPAK